MSESRFLVRKVAVLGAGVMGAQIAAHLANASVPVLLFDLAAKEGDANGIAQKAIENLRKLEPSPLATKDRADYIDAANYDQHLALLAGCDLVIEAISERMDWKKALYEKVAPHLGGHAIFASNTSGLSINALAEACPASLRSRFCGIHFFNPPRYMHLVELIAQKDTESTLLDQLETFLVTTLGKGVVRARDTPNFVANRVGVFSMLATMVHTERFGLGFDVVDALTGPVIGRAKSATYRTADVVGLDTLAHVIRTMDETLPADPWHAYYQSPAWLKALIAKGALGQKTKAGVFQKVGKDIQVLDVSKQAYRNAEGTIDPGVAEILALKDPAAKFARLRANDHPQAQFLWSIFRDLFHYAAYHLASIADNARDVDLAIRWGFGWQMGPFETWQAAGWKQIAQWIADDIAEGKALVAAPLPAWVNAGPASDGVHTPAGAYSPDGQRLCAPLERSRCTSGNIFRIRSSARNGPKGRRSWRPMLCGCGTRVTTSRSSPSRASPTPSARTCSTACWPRSPRPKGTGVAWSSGRRTNRFPSAPTSRRSVPRCRRAGGIWSRRSSPSSSIRPSA